MKKFILTCAILCASQIYGMENPTLQDLPQEVIVAIITKYDNPDDAINALKALSVTNKKLHAVLNNIQKHIEFWKLVELLAQKYPKTPISKEIKERYPRLNMHQRAMVAIAQKLNMAQAKKLPTQLLLDSLYGKEIIEKEKL